MLTLSYGYKKPQTGDKGSIFWTALEDNIQRLNDHTHNGVNSAPIPVTSISKGTATISSAGWVSQGGGVYRQEITMPAGYTYAGYQIMFQITGGTHAGATVYPRVELGSSANKYYVYSNDNSIGLTALYV